MEKVKKDIRERATTKFNHYLNSIASQGFDLNDFIFTFGMGLRRFFIIMMNEAILMKHDLAEAYTQYLKDFKLKLMEKTRKFIEDDGGKEMLETFMANTVGEAVNVTKSRLAGFDVFESIGDDLKNGILTMGEEKTFTSVKVVPFTRFINEREHTFHLAKNSVDFLPDEIIDKDVSILSSLLTDVWEGKLTAEQAVKEFEKRLKETKFEARLKDAREELSSCLKGLGIGEEEKKAYMKIIGLDIDTMAETEKKVVKLFKESAEAVALKKENTEEVVEIMSDFKEKCKREMSDLKVRTQEKLSTKEEVFKIVQKFWNTGFGEITLLTEYDPERKQIIEVGRENNRKWLASEFGGEDKMTEEDKRKLYAGSEILKWDGMTKMGLLFSGAVDAYRKELSDILEERKRLGLEIKKDRDGSYILTEDEKVRLENAVRRYFQEKTDLILGSGNKEKGKAFRSVLAEIYDQYISQEIKKRLDACMREPDVKKKFQERVEEKKREKLEPLIKEKEKEIRERVKEKFLEEKKYTGNKEFSDEEKRQMEKEIEKELERWKNTELAEMEKEIEREVYKGIRAEEYKKLFERIKRGEEELPDKIFSGGNTPEAKIVSRLFKDEVISSAERIKGVTARASFAIGEAGENLTGMSLDHLSLSKIKLSEERRGRMGNLNELTEQSSALLNKEEEYYQNQLKIQKAFESEWTKTEEARKRVRTDLKEGGEKLKNLAERLAFFTTVAMTYHPNLMKKFISLPVDKDALLPLLKMGEEESIIENEFLKRLYIDKDRRIDDWEKIKKEVNKRAREEYKKRYGKLSIENPFKEIKKKMGITQAMQEEVKRFWEIKKEIYLEMLDNMSANREEVEKKIQEIEKRDNPKKFSPSSYLYALSLAGASINAKKLISAFGNMVDKANFREIESFLLREGIMSEDGEISIKGNSFNFLKMVSEDKKSPFLLKEMWKNFKSEVEYTEGVTKLTKEIREVLSGKKSLKDFVFRNQMSGDTDKKLIKNAGKRMRIVFYDPQNPEKSFKDISDSRTAKGSDVKKKEKKGRDKNEIEGIVYNPVLDMANRFTKLLLQLIEKEEEKKETEAVKNLGDKILKGKEQLEEKRLLSRFVKKFRKNNNNSPKPKPQK